MENNIHLPQSQSRSSLLSLNFPFNLDQRDLSALASRYIDRKMAEAAWLRRGDSIFCAEVIGHKPTATRDYSGLVIPYIWPGKTYFEPRGYRIRRDHPDLEQKADGSIREVGKYLGAPGMKNLLFFGPDVRPEMLNNLSVPLLFVEGEFKTLAALRIAFDHCNGGVLPFLPIGLQGVWNWRGVVGKGEGGRPIRGAISDLERISFDGRDVILFRDSNVFTNEKVEVGWRNFAYHLSQERGARVFETEAPDEPGINGLDDLAGRHGPDAMLRLVEDARPQRRYSSPIRKQTTEEVKSRAAYLQKATTAEEKANAIIGAKATQALARLMAECDLSAESRDLIFVLLAMAATDGYNDGSELKFEYKDLYPLLFRKSGGFDGLGRLKSSARSRIRARFDKLEAEQKECRITFVYLTPGHKDDDQNNVPSHVRLYARQHITEIEARAEADSEYKRGYRNASRERATTAWVKENAGAAYITKKPKPKGRDLKIADGLARTKGNLEATIKRMRERGDSEENMWRSICEILPPELLAFVQNTDLYLKNKQVSDSEEFPPELFPDEERKNTPVEDEKILTSEWVSNPVESTDGHAQNGDFTPKNAEANSELSSAELWGRVEQSAREVEERQEAEEARERERILTEPMPEPGAWENPHTDESPSEADAFDLPMMKCDHCGAALAPRATACKGGCTYTWHYWEANAKELGLVRPAIWHAGEADYEVSVRLPAIRGEDGQRYVYANGIEEAIPVGEIEFKRDEE